MAKIPALTNTTATLVGPLLQRFFMEHLTHQKRVSPRTIHSYRDTFRLLLQFLHKTTGKEPVTLTMTDLDAPAVLQFLEHIERERHNQVQSRNVRLAAIRSFARMVALYDPASVGIATRVLAIPVKRSDKRLVGYLTRPEMDALLAAHDLQQWAGRRDHALLLTLYNTGARVSEMTTLQRPQVTFGLKSFVQFTGKGRKERAVPLWPTTSRVLQA
jgi:integrase/recombinase XerD